MEHHRRAHLLIRDLPIAIYGAADEVRRPKIPPEIYLINFSCYLLFFRQHEMNHHRYKLDLAYRQSVLEAIQERCAAFGWTLWGRPITFTLFSKQKPNPSER